MPRQYHHYRRPALSAELERRHCASCGAERDVRDLAPFDTEKAAPEGIAKHYCLPVCDACRAKQDAPSNWAKKTEDATYLLQGIRNFERELLGEMP